MKNTIAYFSVLALLAGCGNKPAEETGAAAAAAAAIQKAAQGEGQRAGADDFCYQIRYSDDPGKIREFLDKGADVNARDSKGFTPLVTALQYGAGGTPETQEKIVDLLLERGADVNADNAAALFEAIGGGSLPLVTKLLDRGANANAAGPNGRTPLMAAASAQSCEITSLLLDRGADPNAKAADGKNAWAIAFDLASSFRTEKTMNTEKLLRGRTSRADIESILRGNKSLKGYVDVDKWLRDNP